MKYNEFLKQCLYFEILFSIPSEWVGMLHPVSDLHLEHQLTVVDYTESLLLVAETEGNFAAPQLPKYRFENTFTGHLIKCTFTV